MLYTVFIRVLFPCNCRYRVFLQGFTKYKFVRSFTVFWAVGLLFIGFLQIIFHLQRTASPNLHSFRSSCVKITPACSFCCGYLRSLSFTSPIAPQSCHAYLLLICSSRVTCKCKKASKQYGPGDTRSGVAKLRAHLSAIPPNYKSWPPHSFTWPFSPPALLEAARFRHQFSFLYVGHDCV